MVGGPASVIVIVVEVRLDTLRVVLHDSRANISTLLGLLISSNVIVQIGTHNERPVHRIQVAELGILLDSYGTPRDVPQVVEADVLQAGQLKYDQGVVVEQVTAPDHSEIRKESAEAVQPGYAEEEKVIRNHGQFGETEGAEDLLVVIVFASDEEDLQVSLNHCTVLQPLEVTDVIANVNAWTTDWKEENRNIQMIINADCNIQQSQVAMLLRDFNDAKN